MTEGGQAPAAETPAFSFMAYGQTNRLALSTNLNIADADLGKIGKIFLAFQHDNTWLFNNGSGWVSAGAEGIPAFAAGPLADQTIAVWQDQDMSSLVGGQLYVGYGVDERDMAANNKFAMVYDVPLATTAPMVTSTVIANGSRDVAINTAIAATFNVDMDPASINQDSVTVLRGTTPVLGNVRYSGKALVFQPLNPLLASASYTATIKGGSGGVRDLAGNALARDVVWRWTTQAPTTPQVVGTEIANGAMGVQVATPVVVKFSEAMQPATLSPATVAVVQGSQTVPGTIIYADNGLTFVPANPLQAGVSYTATIKGGADGARSAAGGALPSDFSWSWTTGRPDPAAALSAPTVVGTAIANGATGVANSAAITATFSEAMNAGSITMNNVLLRRDGTLVLGNVRYSNMSVTFEPLGGMLPNATYTATIKGGSGGVQDVTGTVLANDYVWRWTTGG